MPTALKLGLLTTLYLSQGLPFGFFTQALPVLLRQRGLSLKDLGLASFLAVPWALKFLWAPLLDGGSAGKRRWVIVATQLTSAAVLGLLAFAPPEGGLGPLYVAVFVINALAATQDIATDALAVSFLDEHERGWANGIQVAGYRVGMVLGGGLLVMYLDRLGWTTSFLAMGATLLLATVPIALHREQAAAGLAPRPYRDPAPEPAAAAPAGSPWGAFRYWLGQAERSRWLLFLAIYKAGEHATTAMLKPMLVDAGLKLDQIGKMMGVAGFTAGLIGSLLGGALVGPLGRRRALIVFGLGQTLAVACYAPVGARHREIAAMEGGIEILYVLCVLEHLASGMATASLFTAMMDRCRRGHEATDYTLQASVVVMATLMASAASGVSAASLGYGVHFALSAGVCLLAVGWIAAVRPPATAP